MARHRRGALHGACTVGAAGRNPSLARAVRRVGGGSIFVAITVLVATSGHPAPFWARPVMEDSPPSDPRSTWRSACRSVASPGRRLQPVPRAGAADLFIGTGAGYLVADIWLYALGAALVLTQGASPSPRASPRILAVAGGSVAGVLFLVGLL